MTNTGQRLKQKVKSHIPKDWLTEIRITYRILMETARGISQTGLINIAIITTMAAILTIFGLLFRSTLSISTIVSEMGSVLEISAYLKNGADVQEAVKQIKQFDHVERITFIPKEKSWVELKKEISLPNIQNPLPDTLHIKVDSTKYINDVMDKLPAVKGIDDTSYAKDLVKKFELINNI